ncbi:hypothetical protein R6Q59_008699 [Mikania micrantha]
MNEFEYGTRTGLTAPPREMIALDMARKIRAFLYDHGVMLVHVIAPDSVFYLDFLQNLKEVFFKVYKIDLDNDTECLMLVYHPFFTNLIILSNMSY